MKTLFQILGRNRNSNFHSNSKSKQAGDAGLSKVPNLISLYKASKPNKRRLFSIKPMALAGTGAASQRALLTSL